MSTPLTPRQFGVIADYMAAGNPLAVAALAAGVLPPVAEAAIGESPWFAEVLEESRRLQAMQQPEWLDRVRRMMRGVIERAVAEERVSLLHLAARQVDVMAPEKFDSMEEKRGVEALLHAMSSMTHAQLVEWQSISRRGPAWEAHRAAQAEQAASPPASEAPAPAGTAGAAPSVHAAPLAAAPPAAGADDGIDEPAAGDEMKAALRQCCPWPGTASQRRPGTLPEGGFAGAPHPTPEQAADPRMAPASEIRPSAGEAVPIRPWAGDRPEPQPSPEGAKPRTIPMPRVVLSRLPLGKSIPDWIDQEPPGRWRQRPT